MMTKKEAKARLRPSRFNRFAVTNFLNIDVKFLMIYIFVSFPIYILFLYSKNFMFMVRELMFVAREPVFTALELMFTVREHKISLYLNTNTSLSLNAS